MITSHLNTYYFIPTTIIIINQGLNSFKYYFFIHSLFIIYSFIFLTTTHLPTFFYSIANYYNRKKLYVFRPLKT